MHNIKHPYMKTEKEPAQEQRFSFVHSKLWEQETEQNWYKKVVMKIMWHKKAVLCLFILEYEDFFLKINLFIIQLHQMIIDKIFPPVFQNSFSLFYANQIYIAVTRGGNLEHLKFYRHDTHC